MKWVAHFDADLLAYKTWGGRRNGVANEHSGSGDPCNTNLRYLVYRAARGTVLYSSIHRPGIYVDPALSCASATTYLCVSWTKATIHRCESQMAIQLHCNATASARRHCHYVDYARAHMSIDACICIWSASNSES